MAIAVCLIAVPGWAVDLLKSPEPQHVFADGRRTVETRWHNAAAEPVRVEVRLQLLQLTSATAAPVGDVRPWKTLNVLPGQTVLESAAIEFPKVRVSTRFAARWLGADGKVLGVSEVWAHPEHLLDTLKQLAGGQPLGLSDAAGVLRPALAARGIAASELNSAESWGEFHGRLALVVSQSVPNQGELRLDPAAVARVKAGLAVVWFRPPQRTSSPALTVAERVALGRGAVVLAPASTLTGLDQSATAQLALVQLVELALAPPSEILASEP